MEEIRRQLRQTGRAMQAGGLTLGNAGNISARLNSTRYLITASGTHLGDLEDEDFVPCSMTTGVISGHLKPSKETPMHEAVYTLRPEIGAVLHASPFYTALAACSDLTVPANLFVEDMYYLERVARIGYFHPGSQALADAVKSRVKETNIILLENHGVLVYDISLKEALMAMLTLEMVCRMMITARQAHLTLQPLPDDMVKAFLNAASYRPRRDWER